MRRRAAVFVIASLGMVAIALVAVTSRWTREPDLLTVASRVAGGGGVILLAVAAAMAFGRRVAETATATVAAVAWQGSLLVTSGEAPHTWRSAAMYASAFALPALGALTGPGGARWLWALPVVAGLVWAATYNPFADVNCDTFCGTNVLLLHGSLRTAAAAFDAQQFCVVGLGAVGAALALRNRHAAPVVLGTALSLTAAAGWMYAHDHHWGTRAASSVAVLALASLAVMPIRAAVMRAVRLLRLRRLAAAITTDDGRSLQEGLRAALGDTTLKVAYPTVGGSLIGADGRSHVISAGRGATRLTAGGQTVAVIDHDASVEARDVRDSFGSAAMLAAWNEGLSADLRRQLTEVSASRRRLLVAGDLERRRLERDLHDGVQQALLALLFDLRRAMGGATGEHRAALAESVELVSQALASTRSLANGMFPAMVDQAGLASVLHSLVEHGNRPVEVDVDDIRLPPAIARTVHDTVAAVVGGDADRPTKVVARVEGDRLRIQIAVPGVPLPPATEDRIVALGGTYAATAELWTVELPCVS